MYRLRLNRVRYKIIKSLLNIQMDEAEINYFVNSARITAAAIETLRDSAPPFLGISTG